MAPVSPLPTDLNEALPEAASGTATRGWFGITRQPALRLSEAVRQRLVATLYAQPGTMIGGAVCTVGISAVAYDRTAEPLWLAWLAAALLLFAWRWIDTRAFRLAVPDPTRWGRRFSIAAWINGLWWGVASVAIMTQSADQVVQLMLIAVQVGYLGAAAVRNASLPRAAIGQVLLAQAPLFVACLASDEPYMRLFSLFVVQHIVASVLLVRYISHTRTELLLMDERNARLLERLRQANDQLEEQALTDGLTGLANRRAFDAALLAEMRRAKRARQPLSLLLIDIDLFKALNDRLGHQAGDRCLAAVATVLAETVRDSTDTVARYGGEEFAVVLPFTDKAGAAAVAEKLRASVETLAWEAIHGQPAPLTVSIGGTTMLPDAEPETDVDPAPLIAAADTALYRAKSAGRNCVRW